MLFIKNGYMINPRTGFEGNADIIIKNDKVLKVIPGGGITMEEVPTITGIDEEVNVLDARGQMIAPGLVDVHVHFRDPGFSQKEDIITGAKAAAKGGFTTVVLMANTKPVVDNTNTIVYVRNKGKGTKIHVETCAAVTEGMQGKHLVLMEQLKRAGAVGFTDDGVPLLEEELVREAMEISRELDVPLSFHEENPQFIENNGIHRGKASRHYGIGGSPREAEIDLVARDLNLAIETGAKINIQHISTKEAVDLIRHAKTKSGNIHAEATPHHFSLTQEAVIQHGTMGKMNPPLREEEDRMAIIQGLKDKTIDIIATDHAPHTAEEKALDIKTAPSGIIGLETALSLGITNLVKKGHLTMMELIDRMSLAPAQLYGFNVGYLEEGGPADFVIFDPDASWKVMEFESKSCNSPFIGEELFGTVKYTFCAGAVVYSNK